MTVSSGLLLFRLTDRGVLQVLIAHMGGPFWARKHQHAWSIPKGIAEDGETDLLEVAVREFREEMGISPTDGPTRELGSVKSGTKRIHVFAREGSFDIRGLRSNEFEMEWPKGSGLLRSFPEVDRADWFTIAEARDLLVKGQGPFLDRLVDSLRDDEFEFSLEVPSEQRLF